MLLKKILFYQFFYIIIVSTVIFGLFSSCKIRSASKAPSSKEIESNPSGDHLQLVARVEGIPIYRKDLLYEAKGQGLIKKDSAFLSDSPLYDQILEDLIDQKLLAFEAQKQGLDKDPLAQKRLSSARERILGNLYVENAVKNSVTEKAIKRLYQEQRKLLTIGSEVRARHILVASEAEAKKLKERILAGEDFDKIAYQYSLDEGTREQGGDLGYFTADAVSKKIADIAFTTPIGTVSKPFKTVFGWNILKPMGRREEKLPSYEEMKGKIVNFLTFEKLQSVLKDLRNKADIKRFNSTLPSVVLPEEQKNANSASPKKKETIKQTVKAEPLQLPDKIKKPDRIEKKVPENKEPKKEIEKKKSLPVVIKPLNEEKLLLKKKQE